MKVNSYNHTGKKLDQATLPKSVFAVSVSPDLMAQAVHVHRKNQSQYTSKTKTRSQVSLTKSKWYQQKGTGRARHGAKSAPIFVGGGIAHGPKGIKPKNKKLNKKMRRSSLRGAFTFLANQRSTFIVEDLDKIKPKTVKLNTLLNKITDTGKPILILINQQYPNLSLAAGNIPNLTVTNFNQVNIHQLLKTQTLIIDKKALKPLKNWLSK